MVLFHRGSIRVLYRFDVSLLYSFMLLGSGIYDLGIPRKGVIRILACIAGSFQGL